MSDTLATAHTYRPPVTAQQATEAGQAAAMRARRDGLTESECATMYRIAYAATMSEAGK